MAPSGIKALMHDKTRTTWAHKGKTGWYVGPSMSHYRCINIYVPPTQKLLVSETVELFPEKIDFPKFTITEAIVEVLNYIKQII